MSGDVQPRKRREKKKKKEDGPEDVIFQHQHPPMTSPIVTDDLNIHIQKEASTGGGLCAKFVFFILLTMLTTIIGLIITEHRGLTDLDTIDAESRFAQLFEGWIDAPSIDHESGEDLSLEQSEEHASEEEEEQDHDEEEEQDHDDEEEEDDNDQDQSVDYNDEEEEEEEDDDDDDDDDKEISEEQAVDQSTADEENYEEESELQDDTIETESEEVSNENDEEAEEDEDEQEDDDDEEEQEYASEDGGISYGDRDASSLPTKEDVTQEDSGEDKEEQEDSEETLDKTAETEESKYPTASEEATDLTESEEAVDETVYPTESEEDADRAGSEEAASLDDTDKGTKKAHEKKIAQKIETSTTGDSIETIVKVRPAKRVQDEKRKTEKGSEDADEPQEMDNYNMAIKFGVGTALLVVAHVVLVQKWRTEAKISATKPQEPAEETESVTPDLSRRNTIVTPPSLQEIEQDIENVEEEYSEDDEDYDSEDDSRSKPASAKMRYQELQSTYSHTLSPDWEPKEVRENRNRNSEEEEEELEGDEDYDDEISENEDEELLTRLEAKYGRVRHSDEEPDEELDDDADADNDDEEEELEENRNTDFDSWRRVKVPSGNVPEDSESENEKDWPTQHSGAQAIYDFENITNSDDWQIREELDQAQQNIANDAAYALTLFNTILERNPSSPRALYGKAQSLDILAEEKRSNNLLQQAIVSYQQIFKVTEVPDALFQMAAERCIDRMRFRGHYGQAVPIHKLLIEKFPEEVKFANHLAVTYLTTNKINEARQILHETLIKWPSDGFALVHYGFILKTNDNDLKQAVEFLQRGIKTKEPGVIDGRFYFHLGDALTRLGRKEEAMSIYSDGVANKVFLSKYQRSLYNVDRLTGKPWWEKEETPYVPFFEKLESNWEAIRDEGLSILNRKGYFQPEAENLRDVGDWKQFELFARGVKNSKNCEQCPITCKIVETVPDAIGCRRGQIKFSVMHPGTHVWPHCGPTNCRLRSHLGLKVPSNTYIRVGEEIRSWEEGKLLIFDDSFEHEVWHNGTATRLVLIIDIWHPELTKREKQSISSI